MTRDDETIGSVLLDVPAGLKYLNIVGACVGELLAHVDGLADPLTTVYQLQLAVHEVCANSVEHAYAGRADARVRLEMAVRGHPRQFEAEVRDDGLPFEGSPGASLEGAPRDRGYGLHLVRELVDELHYERSGDGNRWRLVKLL